MNRQSYVTDFKKPINNYWPCGHKRTVNAGYHICDGKSWIYVDGSIMEEKDEFQARMNKAIELLENHT